MELLRTGDESALRGLVVSERRSVRYLLGRLWDSDDELRCRAARALGAAAAADFQLGQDLLRRLMWALNDESATNGVYAVPAFAEIGIQAPQVVAPFVAPLASYLWDEGLQPAILDALRRIAEAAPELVAPVANQIIQLAPSAELEWVDSLFGPESGEIDAS